MKILVVTESLRINETSSGIVSSTFLSALLDNNNEIVCLYNKNFHDNITWLNGVRLIELDNVSYKKNFFVDAIPRLRGLVTYVDSGLHSETKHEINRWKTSIEKVISKEKFDLIITLGSGSEFYPYYSMLNVKKNIPWLANFHDPYPFSVYPKPYKQKRNILLLWQEYFAGKIINKADFLSFPSLYLKTLMQEKYHFEDSKFVILPHVGIALNNLPSSKLDNEVYLHENKFNLLHAGTLLGPRKVETLFNAFKKFISLSKEKQDLSILNILGKVAKEHKNIKDIITEYPNNFNVITERVSYKKSLELTKQANVSLVIEADAEFSPFMPGKLADLIYLEKPILVLSPKKAETIRILGDDYPYQARVNDESEILKILNLLWDDWQKDKLNTRDFKKYKKYISAEMLNNNINKLIQT